MKKILEYIAYVSAVVHAISEGAKVASTHWPANNPFITPKNEIVKQPEIRVD
jgi:hypothetical protein